MLLLVEGQTEERFVKDVLQPHLWGVGVSVEPKIVVTRQVVGGPSAKGGGDFSKILADLRRLLGDSNAVAVSTLFDLYGFPRNVPGADATVPADVDRLEEAIAAAVDDRRFRPYLQRHEFEAFLFVDPAITAGTTLDASRASAIAAQKAGFNTVEDINNNFATAPSRRLMTVLGSYRKTLLGPTVTQRLGLQRLRAAAPRFSAWVGWLESHGPAAETGSE